MKNINLGDFIINLNDDVKYERYHDKHYDGIIFYDKDGGKYDVVNNYLMGYRLIINNHEGFKDIPFRESTFCFLPAGVEVKFT